MLKKLRGRLVPALALASLALSLNASTDTVPSTQCVALNGSRLTLPRDLPANVTVLVIGFSRSASSASTAWEKAMNEHLVNAGSADYLGIALLADVPSLARLFVLRSMKGQIPAAQQSKFLTITEDEAAWKSFAGYMASAPNAAYLVIVDKTGVARWRTHEVYSPALFDQLTQETRKLAAAKS